MVVVMSVAIHAILKQVAMIRTVRNFVPKFIFFTPIKCLS